MIRPIGQIRRIGLMQEQQGAGNRIEESGWRLLPFALPFQIQ
jgi:hypothetical protein